MCADVAKYEDDNTNKKSKDPNGSQVKGDWLNIALLIGLYFLQGIPLGFTFTIPMYLQNRHVSYDDQAIFSISHWPFGLKILWAPLVDSIYSSSFGRRKSWLVPVQYLLGIILFFVSMNLNEWLGDESGQHKPNIPILTVMFLACYFLAAVQDVAVDGWALTMLRRENVGHASTCNVIGQSLGSFSAYTISLNLDSAEFCNKWLRSTPQPTGIVSLPESMRFWSIVYIVSTTLVAIFKKEKNMVIIVEEEEQEISLNIPESFRALWSILKLKSVQSLILLVSTCKIGTIAGSVSGLKTVEYGVPKEKLAILEVPLMPLQFILPFILNRFIIGPRPLDMYLAVVPLKLILNIIEAILVYYIPQFIKDHELPLWFYGILLLIAALQSLTGFCQFVAMVGYFARVSDPRCGGTYMTLLNTIANLSAMIPGTIALWLVEVLTYKECSIICNPENKACVEKEVCHKILDGYYVEIAICTVIGIVWLLWSKSKFRKLQDLPEKNWLLPASAFIKQA